jgi:hypothetical protein
MSKKAEEVKVEVKQMINQQGCHVCGNKMKHYNYIATVVSIPASQEPDGEAVELVLCPHCLNPEQFLKASEEAQQRVDWLVRLGNRIKNGEIVLPTVQQFNEEGKRIVRSWHEEEKRPSKTSKSK